MKTTSGFLLSLLSLAIATPVPEDADDTERNVPLDVCLDRAQVENYIPTDAFYETASESYNLRLDPDPAVVVYPKSAQEISAALGCASKRHVPVTTRGGGHSYAAYGLGGTDGHLVVDLKYLDSYSYDDATQNVKVGAGRRLGDLALSLADNGRAMPHGTCPTVGLGGHAAHGGYGFYSRLWGLTLDRVIGHEVVLADGSIVQTSAETTPDLFFALKGAAPSYGVITSYTMTTEPLPTENVRFLVTWDVTAAQAADAFVRWQEYLPSAPPELGMAFRMFKGSTNSTLRLDFLGQFLGTVDGLYAELGPQIDALGTPFSNNIVEEIEWLPMLEWLAGTPLATADLHIRDTFYAKSLAIKENSLMTHDQALALTTHLTTATDISWFAMADNWGGQGSVINAVPLESTSFGSRSNLFGWQLYGFTPDSLPPFPADGVPFVQGMWDAIVNSAPAGWTYGGYVNYIDPELSAQESYKVYYAAHIQRLTKLKRKFDPRNLFSFPQSIGQ